MHCQLRACGDGNNVSLCSLKAVHQNGLSMNQAFLGLSPSILPGPKEGDLATHDIGHEAKRMHLEKGQSSKPKSNKIALLFYFMEISVKHFGVWHYCAKIK